MTDRVKGFTVTLEHDIRIDDVEYIMNAIRMIKGVTHVEPSISSSEDHFIRMRVYGEVKDDLYKFIKEKLS